MSQSLIALRKQEENRAQNLVEIKCAGKQISLHVSAKEEEWGSTFYYGLHKLGFYFPHPRKQISPSRESLYQHCGKTYEWKPRLEFRGYHLHTQHPNEWVSGFFMGETKIATDFIRWVARNGQNIFEVYLLQKKFSLYQDQLRESFALAKNLGISPGIVAGFSYHQQNAQTLVSFISALRGMARESLAKFFKKRFKDKPVLRHLYNFGTVFRGDHDNTREIKRSLNKLIELVDFDFLTLEAGTSEFTTTGEYQKAIDWMNLVALDLKTKNKQLFVKVHVPSGHNDQRFGNFNFLPQHTDPAVGVLPHTVYLYGVDDEEAPMYENKNFHHIRDFMIQENKKRPTWFYPETSYFIVMDIDHPLFLTDYLITRSNDIDLLEKNSVRGQINFTTGHELGYWLMDWTTALLAFDDYRGDPLAGIKLLGEDPKVWQDILDFQNKYFKQKQLIPLLTSPNFQDEIPEEGLKVLGGAATIPYAGQIHDRVLLSELEGQKAQAQREADQLKEAWAARPSLDGVKDTELKALLNVTWLRIMHSYHVRKALTFDHIPGRKGRASARSTFIANAKDVRMQALKHITYVKENHSRYPESRIFQKWRNPTAYDYGYGYHAQRLYYWERDEEMVRRKKYSPWFMINECMLWEVASPIDNHLICNAINIINRD